MAWMLYDSYPRVVKTTITSLSILELMWISTHSTTLQDCMTKMVNSMSDQLRIEGIKTEVCLLNLDAKLTICHLNKVNNLNQKSMDHSSNCKPGTAKGQFTLLVYILQLELK